MAAAAAAAAAVTLNVMVRRTKQTDMAQEEEMGYDLDMIGVQKLERCEIGLTDIGPLEANRGRTDLSLLLKAGEEHRDE